jgi:hypothetical protein
MAPEETAVRWLVSWFHKVWRGHRRYDEVIARLDAIDAKLTRLLALWEEPR